MICLERPMALTMGEPSGIGGEITLKTWDRRFKDSVPPFFVIDDTNRLRKLGEELNWNIRIQEIQTPHQALEVFSQALPVLDSPLRRSSVAGSPHLDNCPAVIASIIRAVNLVQAGDAAAVVTNPIQKKILYESGFSYSGHTDFLAHLVGCKTKPIMMLICDSLRVVPVTVHQSLLTAISTLNKEDILEAAKITIRALKLDFGILRPQVVVAALNPHAGEQGSMGREEIEIIEPAVEELKRSGISVSGPMPADTLFHSRARTVYDAAICMYHDQALIPLKTIDFRNSVNVTLGLPFVRTSPDHGTALEIAGKGVADEMSLVAALKTAASIVKNRNFSLLHVQSMH